MVKLNKIPKISINASKLNFENIFMITKFFLIIGFLLLSLSGRCRNDQPNQNIGNDVNRGISNFALPTPTASVLDDGLTPKVTFPSPQAANFARYGDIPVDYSTGVPKIEIPLYTVKSGKLELPINISYHAGGIKVTDVASEVGLGWVLNTGGNITYLQVGQVDGYGSIPPYKSKAEIDSVISNAQTQSQISEAKSYLYQISTGNYDLQSDRYHYNIGNESGVIRRNFETNQLTKIPYSPIIVNDQDLKIISKEGVIYCFEPLILMRSTGITNLVKMISSDLQDTISLSYKTTLGDLSVMHLNHSLEWGPMYEWVGGGAGCTGLIMQLTNSIKNSFSYSNSLPSSRVLEKITSRTTRVEFYYDTTNLDMKKKNMLVRIDIYSNETGNLIREILFDHSSFGTSENNNLRLRLDAVHIKGIGSQTDEKYSFSYNSNELPPYYTDANSCCEDYWGFYNGGCGNTSSIPMEFLPTELMSMGGDRNPDSNMMDACIIKEISYPTGGKTEFEFEANQADDGQSVYSYNNNKVLGGLRIKTIKNYINANSSPILTSYEYSSAMFRPITSDLFTYGQNYYYFKKVDICPTESGITERNCAISSAVCPMTFSGNSSVIYLDVKEYRGTPLNNAGKTEYSYELSNTYDDYPDSYPIRFKDIFYADRGINQARLKFKKDFSWHNGIYEPVKLFSYDYDFAKVNQIPTGYTLNKTITYIISSDANQYEYDVDPSYLNNFISTDTKAFEDIPLLVETTEHDFINGIPKVEKRVLFSYDNHTQLRKKIEFNSQNDSIITTYTYPYDLAGEPYETMVQRNFISPIIEQSEKKNTNLLQSIKNNYYNPSGNVIAPLSTQQTIGEETSTLASYSYDDKGKIIQYIERNGLITSFLWGYNNAYPVAKIVSGVSITISDALRNTINSYLYCGTDSTSGVDADITFLKNQLTNYSSENQVSIYTYKPLYGLTSQTDPNGKTTYYKYDDFGRLKFTKDDQYKIIKKFSYHYKE